MSRRPAMLCVVMVVLFGLALAACGDQGTDGLPPSEPGVGPPRSFAMGLSSLPAELTEESYGRAFELAATAGDVIMIQRTPPWEELLAGEVSEETARTTQRERQLAEEDGLDLFVAIDPTDVAGERSELANLPPELRGAGFADEQIRSAFVDYAKYVAENYHPKYLALGVEINSYQHQHPEDFEQFVTLYHQTYDGVKALSPETLVFPIFQLEELQGLLPTDQPYPPQWYLIQRFEPRLDLLAVSSYPDLAFPAAEEIPGSYFAQLQSYTDRPIVIAGTGYSSGDDANENQQVAYLRRVLDGAQQLSMPLLVWLVGQDPTFTSDVSLGLLQHIGLLRQDGTEKPAWRAWLEASRRPLQTAGS